MRWIHGIGPRTVKLNLSVYECPHCLKRVIALPEIKEIGNPNINDYYYCPYCGKELHGVKKPDVQ